MHSTCLRTKNAISLAEPCENEVLKKFVEVSEYKSYLMNSSITAKLSLLYIEYINIVKNFIKAVITGDCHLHFLTVKEMLPLLAATRHNHYAKTSCIYLQEMAELSKNCPWLYEHFINHPFQTKLVPLAAPWYRAVFREIRDKCQLYF